MTTWREFVKETQTKYKISYKDAMQKASPLWKKKKDKKTRIKKSKKQEPVVPVPDVVDYPKLKETESVTKKEVPRTVEQENEITKRRARNKARRRLKKSTIKKDKRSRRVAKKSGV